MLSDLVREKVLVMGQRQPCNILILLNFSTSCIRACVIPKVYN